MENLRSLLKERKNIGYYVHSNWIFSNLFEKALLVGFIGLGIWKILEWIF